MRSGRSIGPRASAVSVLSSEFVLLLKIPRNNLGGVPARQMANSHIACAFFVDAIHLRETP